MLSTALRAPVTGHVRQQASTVSDPAYDQAWSAFRGHVRFMRIAERLWFVPVIFAAGVLLAMVALEAKAGSPTAWVIFLVSIGFVVAFRIVADVRLKTFRCPRCGRPFVSLRLLQRAPLTSIDRRFPCQHCGLPVEAVSANVDKSVA
jgi:transcription elongation factor Elf1